MGNLHKILHNKTVTSKIAEYFVYKYPVGLCYRYTSTISRHIVNNKQTSEEFDQSTGNTNVPCKCNSYPNFIHPQVGNLMMCGQSAVERFIGEWSKVQRTE